MGILNFLHPKSGIYAMVGNTAIGNLDRVHNYLNDGVNINAFCNKLHCTALMVASFGGRPEVVKYLLKNGADPELLHKKQDVTALYMARARLDDWMSGKSSGERGKDVEIQSLKEVIKLLQ